MTFVTFQNERSGTEANIKGRGVLKKDDKSETQNSYTRLSLDSTTQKSNVERPQRIYREVLGAFREARDESFEFGVESLLTRRLLQSVRHYGVIAIEAIASIILNNQAEPQVSAETLRWLGDLNHPASYYLRLKLLEVNLKHESRWVRDGALLGLDAMGDQRAIPSLSLAMETEPLTELREDIRDVITSLSAI